MKKLNRMALFGATLAFVMLVAIMFVATTNQASAQATDTPTAGATTSAATTASATTTAATTSAATTTAATTSAATTAAATTASSTTTAATTSAATTAAATTTAATTAPATTAAAAKGANTSLPLYTPNKPITLTADALSTFDKAFKGAGGAATANAKYDFFFTPDGESKIVAYYDNAMKTLGYSQVGKNSTSESGFSGTAYAYSNGTDGKIVTVLGPLTASQSTSFNTQLQSGSSAAGDTLVILVSGIASGSAQGGASGPTTAAATTAAPAVPATGIGGTASNDGGFNALWLLLPLALISAMSTVALVARRKTNR